MLPHLHGLERYQWQIDFFESTNRYNFLTAANQIGKSSIQICKAIHWATCRELWPKLWGKNPTQFWYFYSDASQATVEYTEKWVKEFLPRGEMRNHPDYGWRPEFDSRKKIYAIHFNTGVSIYFRTYEQSASSLQASTVFAIFADEEMSTHLFDEVNVRLIANRGFFHMVFTATKGQDFWRLTMEPGHGEKENFEGAFKRQVSMYDCLFYANGKPSKWSEDYIKEIERSCSDENERQRRVYGRFVKSEGLLVNGFRRSNNTTTEFKVPDDWVWYSGVDPGTGGGRGHPTGIVFVAVSPDYKQGKVVDVWRGDDVITSSSDILSKYQTMRKGRRVIQEKYDYGGIGKDYGILAERAGEGFVHAKKDRDLGFGILNDLFRLQILEIVLIDNESEKLCVELGSAASNVDKTHAKDDLIDALRYAIVDIPWVMMERKKKDVPDLPKKFLGRGYVEDSRRGIDLLVDEFDEWNDDCEFLGY
jgi:hypothetical protein